MYAKDIFNDMSTEIIWDEPLFNKETPRLGRLILEDIYESDLFFC